MTTSTFESRRALNTAIANDADLTQIVEDWDALPNDLAIKNGDTVNDITYTFTDGSAFVTTNGLNISPPQNLGFTTGFSPTQDTITFEFSMPVLGFGVSFNTSADQTGDYIATTQLGDNIPSFFDPYPGFSTGGFIGFISDEKFTSVTLSAIANASYGLDDLTLVFAPSETFVVTTLVDENDGGPGGAGLSLREAIALSNTSPGNDVIQFTSDLAGGTIGLELGELTLTDSVTIEGNTITIDAQRLSRVFNIDDGNDVANQKVILENLTITGGDQPSLRPRVRGVGIRNRENLTVRNSTVTDNGLSTYGAVYGGGIYSNGTLTVQNSTISGNSEGNGLPYGLDSIDGGGIWSSGTLIVTDSTISGNGGYGINGAGGGGIRSFGTATISNSTIRDNVLSTYDGIANGGGIESIGTLTVINSTISNNAVTDFGFGGGIDADGGEIINSTISGNASADYGGGIYGENLTITNSTITQNNADYGSGIQGDGVTVNNSIVAGNGGQYDLDVNGTFVSNGANIIGKLAGGTGFNNSETFSGRGITDISQVLDPTLGDNGGPTQTHALVAGSVAIDGGSNTEAVDADGTSFDFDQRGVGFDRIINGAVDIGAFEEQTFNADVFFFSGQGDTTVGNLTFADEDIVYFDGSDFSILFDGSQLLSGNVKISAFDVTSSDEILMSFSRTVNLDGLGSVDAFDVVKFTVDSLGKGNTAGEFELYMDGSALGLNDASEKIDALTRMEDGSLLFSTVGNANVAGGVTAKDADLLKFTPDSATSLGANTSGTTTLYFDGSDVGLTKSGEDISAAAMRNNQLLLSTKGTFKVPGRGGRDEDAFTFSSTSTGNNTVGTFDSDLFFDASQFGFTGDLSGVDFSVG